MDASTFYAVTGTISFLYTLYAGASYYTYSSKALLSSSVAKRMLKKNEFTHVFDVRTKTEYDLGHYPGAKHVSVLTFSNKKFNTYNKSQPVLVYCNTGQRARRAVDLLLSYGFTNVKYIAGSYTSLL